MADNNIQENIDSNLIGIKQIASDFKRKAIHIETQNGNHDITLSEYDAEKPEWKMDIDPNGKKSRYIPLISVNKEEDDFFDFLGTDCDVLISQCEKGYSMDFHEHTKDGYDTESVQVLKGIVKYTFEEGREVVICSGEAFTLSARTAHKFECLEECLLILSLHPKQSEL